MESNRRNFLKATAIASAPLFVPQSAFGANDRIAYGVIATGGRGRYLNRHFQAVGGQCAALCDVYDKNLEQAVKESPELPLFRIICNASAPPHPQLGRSFLTQDPGRALITGKCADAGSILMQQFRGLSARAPYFANGSAGDLTELVDFYDRRFKIGLTDGEKQDLANFLRIL